MNPDQVLAQRLRKEGVIHPRVAEMLKQPRGRQQAYKALLATRHRQPFHGLLRHLLQAEVAFPTTLTPS